MTYYVVFPAGFRYISIPKVIFIRIREAVFAEAVSFISLLLYASLMMLAKGISQLIHAIDARSAFEG